MTIESMKNTKFPTHTYSEWQQAAEKAIKGKPFEETLKTPTIEDVTLEPLYTKDMLDRFGSYVPAQVAAIQHGKHQPSWLVSQEVTADSAEEYLTLMKDDLLRGNETVVYSGFRKFEWTDEQLNELAQLLVEYPLYFKLSGDDQDVLRVFDFIAPEKQSQLQGVIFSEEPVNAPENVRTQLVDTIPIHHAGGTAVHELGVALSILSEQMVDVDFTESAKNTWIRFAVDTQFFQEIAKLRAFRVLWQAFCSAYGDETPTIPVFTETSVRSYSKLDPYVNLLRAGNSTFAAVLGGTDAHTVHPHDFLTESDLSSRRIARNVQLVIKEEAHVSHVIDPSAGSYFIETLTKEYVEAAWNYFLEIENIGGYSEAIKSGWLTDDIQAKWIEREQNVATRKQSLIGTNIYANPQEAVRNVKTDDSHIEYMTAKRLAIPFEKLRAKSKVTNLKSAIILMEPLKDIKAQVDFVSGFLAVGGIRASVSGYLQTAEQINQFLDTESLDYAILCGSKEVIASVVPALNTQTSIDLAGKYSKEQLAQWQQYGIKDTIYSGKHITSKLEKILALGKEAQ
ncbi:methylmalonyl-CoA mutase family protein [Planococcus halocryophilus]|uniref:methylmalonyl-CoA mutase family protein n=1 Tax=Planococcus halocryophilus TaxID=1215089 RepID=UPI001F10EB49|nr:methylmalonyl-CoA mutase family protein [Planococcus halocryophilus]MCH4825832.1 methylmalonyl-CoA mutase family protein [Planococcus halocryophilus]